MYKIIGIAPEKMIFFERNKKCWKFALLGTCSEENCIVWVRLFEEDKTVSWAEKENDTKILKEANLKKVVEESEYFCYVKEKISQLEEKIKKQIRLKGEAFLGKMYHKNYQEEQYFLSYSYKESAFEHLAYFVNKDKTFSIIKEPPLSYEEKINLCAFCVVKRKEGKGISFIYDNEHNFLELLSPPKNTPPETFFRYIGERRGKTCSFSSYRTFDKDIAKMIISSPLVRIKLLTF